MMSSVSEPAPRLQAPWLLSWPLRQRRQAFLVLVAGTVLGATGLMTWTLSAGGLDALDLLLIALFALTMPWTAIGLWNAAIGLALMRLMPDPAAAVCPPLLAGVGDSPITARTALLCCIRNEDVGTVARNLERMIVELDASGVGTRFVVHVLSDSDWPEVCAAEETRIGMLAARWQGRLPVQYRRRPRNPGYKAGNIRDFCEHHGADYDFALVLDADSLMSADAMLRLVRIMQVHPELGILQSLVVGLPSASAFARPFQFGMRLGMRSYTLGSAWWQGDAGPYWGHNALLRLAPFIAHCELPPLPGRGPLAGWILSHDQLEAVLMRRAGYEVRVLPVEGGSWEENPPTLPDHIRRDLRWCQGNLQYLKMLGLPGLHPVSRAQLLLAILMFVSSPAWVLWMLLGLLRVGLGDGAPVWLPGPGLALFVLVMGMVFAPKLASLIDALAHAHGRRSFGGAPRLLVGSLLEVLFSMLLAPILAIAHSLFMLGLLFGRALVWGPQRRAVHGVPLRTAIRRLWPQTIIGALAFVWVAAFGAAGALLFSPFYVGLVLAIPLAMFTAWPVLGAWVARVGLWCIPDEVAPAPTVAALHLPVFAARPGSAVLEAAVEPGD